ncbi:MAG: ArsR family transcriptional regulator [Alphaproteobacteria bacterium]|nr:MAG: ArsR family transcriptional regulator [Alphaproteobacteria bacterium]
MMDNMKEENVFAALASTPRRKILSYLSQASLTAGEISERFDMSKPSLSKHLRVLEHAGLIVGEKRGQFIHYRLADENLLGSLHDFLTTFCPVGGPLKKEGALIAKTRTARAVKTSTDR